MKRITEKLKRPSVTNDERSDDSIERMTLSEAALYAISYLAIALIVVAFTFMSLAVFPACTKVNGANATEKPVELPTEEPKNSPTKDWPRIVEPVPTEVPDGLGEKELSILNGEIVSLTGGKAVDDGFSGVSIDMDGDGISEDVGVIYEGYNIPGYYSLTLHVNCWFDYGFDDGPEYNSNFYCFSTNDEVHYVCRDSGIGILHSGIDYYGNPFIDICYFDREADSWEWDEVTP